MVGVGERQRTVMMVHRIEMAMVGQDRTQTTACGSARWMVGVSRKPTQRVGEKKGAAKGVWSK